MSRVPVPMRSMYLARYSGSASSGLGGKDPWGSRSCWSVSEGESVPGFHTSNRSANSITWTLPVLV